MYKNYTKYNYKLKQLQKLESIPHLFQWVHLMWSPVPHLHYVSFTFFQKYRWVLAHWQIVETWAAHSRVLKDGSS